MVSEILQSSSIFPTPLRLHRATWVQTELLLTFPPPVVKAITIIPLNADDTAGRFRVWLSLAPDATELIWDRKVEGGFPELKVLVRGISLRFSVLHLAGL